MSGYIKNKINLIYMRKLRLPFLFWEIQMSEAKKKVVKQVITINGREVPYYICPPGMSGQGVDLEKQFNQEDKEEAMFDLVEDTDVLERVLKEDAGFGYGFQKFCEEGETNNPLVEDYIAFSDHNRLYDEEEDRNLDLTKVFRY